jgi:hypothetical protein
MATWIFVCDPKKFRIDDALQELEEITWLVKQNKNSISYDDDVFIYRGGNKNAIVSRAKINSEIGKLVSPPEVLKFWTESARNDGNLPRDRVWLWIESKCINGLSHDHLKSIRGLENLNVGKQGTNLQVSISEAILLNEEWDKRPNNN